MRQDVREIQAQLKEVESYGKDVNEMWNVFQQGLEERINKNIPHKTKRSKDGLPWMTTELRKLIKKHDRLYKKKKSADPKHIEEFKNIKHLVQKKSRHAYWNNVEGLISPNEEKKSNSARHSTSKRLWTFKYK